MMLSLRATRFLAHASCALGLFLALGCQALTDVDTEEEEDPVSFTGVWNRFDSALGRNTDLAVGTIQGEPNNRVYMCELPPSPVAGLYKGTLLSDGVTIRWDSKHGIPDYIMQPRSGGNMEFFIPAASTFAGKYRRGSWTPGACGMSPT